MGVKVRAKSSHIKQWEVFLILQSSQTKEKQQSVATVTLLDLSGLDNPTTREDGLPKGFSSSVIPSRSWCILRGCKDYSSLATSNSNSSDFDSSELPFIPAIS
jgi:hypothetical protein